MVGRLQNLDPLKVLSRGFAVAMSDGQVVKQAAQVKAGDKLTLRLADGCLACTVDKKLSGEEF